MTRWIRLHGSSLRQVLTSCQGQANSTEGYLTGTELYISVTSQWATRDPWSCSSSQQQKTCPTEYSRSLMADTMEKAFSKFSCLPLVSSCHCWNYQEKSQQGLGGFCHSGAIITFGYEHKLGRMWNENGFQQVICGERIRWGLLTQGPHWVNPQSERFSCPGWPQLTVRNSLLWRAASNPNAPPNILILL